MNINNVLTEVENRKIFDVQNLPNELNVGDRIAAANETGSDDPQNYYTVFTVRGKEYDEELGTTKYIAFSDEALYYGSQLDYLFTIEDGKAVPTRGYESVAKEHL